MATRITNKKLSSRSRSWMQEHLDDYYVKLAHKDGYRSRAAYKLLEANEKYHFLQYGMTVVDLGAAPGSWSQIAAKVVGPKGMLVATDILEMDHLPGVEFLQGDFREPEVLANLLTLLEGRTVDLVISDMAPNISGNSAVDQPRMMYLCDLALDFCRQVLKPDGSLFIKVFQGEGFDEFRKHILNEFTTLKSIKPKASRPRSREIYFYAQGKKASQAL